MSWAQIKERAKETTGGAGGKFIKFEKEGDLVEVVPMGDPAERWKLFDEKSRKFSNVEPGSPGAKCEFMLNVYDTTAKAVRVLSLDSRDFGKLADAVEQHGAASVFRIVRTSTTPKRFTVNLVRKLAAAQAEKVQAMEQHDLWDLGGRALGGSAAPAPAEAEATSDAADDDIPF